MPQTTAQHPVKQQPKALVLISGGLDSLLAAKVVQDQGIHVEGINFYTGFSSNAIPMPFDRRIKTKACEIMPYGWPNSSASSCTSLIFEKNTKILLLIQNTVMVST